MKQFDKLSGQDKITYLLYPIVQELMTMGGAGLKTEVKRAVVNHDNNLSERYLVEVKTSRNGRDYHPFDYPFNFAVKDLILAKFVTIPKTKWVALTSEGMNFTGSKQQLTNIVLARALPLRKAAKLKKVGQTNEPSSTDSNEEAKESLESPEDEAKVKIISAIDRLDPYKFEKFCRALMNRMNIEIDPTIGIKKSNDGGLDGYGYLTSDDFRTVRVGVQAKHWSKDLVSSPEIDKFRGAMDKFRADYGIFITTTTFTRDAIKAARSGTKVITLIDSAKLVDLVIKYQLFVKPVTTYVLGDFFTDKG